MKNYLKLLTLTIAVIFSLTKVSAQEIMNLAGEWSYKVDKANEGFDKKFYLQSFSNKATLPASSDQIGIGEMEIVKDSLNGLQRRHSYISEKALNYLHFCTFVQKWR